MRALSVLVFAFSIAACAGSTDPGRAGVPVLGAWSYSGQQVAPGSASLAGAIAFSTQTGAQISGSMDFVETDGRGQQRRVAGPFSGRTVDSTTLDFEVVLGALSRRHVGKVKGDSLTGTWVESSGDGVPTASGTFRSARGR
jgi:hypothetical protein